MNGSKIIATAAALVFSGTLSAPAQQAVPGCCMDQWNPSGMHRDHWRPEHMGPGQRQRMLRHWTFMNEGVPTAYRGERSTVEVTSDTVGEGRALYEANCASCHGTTGMGDGEAGRSLSPSPALLSYMLRMPMAVDEYLLWSISEGGERFDTAMPAFKDALTRDEIWKVIAFMRAGFPQTQSKQ
jgi:mono/diheme cytochrome c family protein